LQDLHGFVRLDGQHTAQNRSASGLAAAGVKLDVKLDWFAGALSAICKNRD
jgi:hypothetical protein